MDTKCNCGMFDGSSLFGRDRESTEADFEDRYGWHVSCSLSVSGLEILIEGTQVVKHHFPCRIGIQRLRDD